MYSVLSIMLTCDEPSLCSQGSALRTLRFCRQRNLLCVQVQLAIAGKVNLLQRMLCCMYSTLGWCGLLGPRPRGGMCRTPPTLSGRPYSTPQSGLLRAAANTFRSRLVSDLVFGQVYPSLVWSAGLEDGKYFFRPCLRSNLFSPCLV